MNLGHYLLLMFSITFIFYLLGYVSPAQYATTQIGNTTGGFLDMNATVNHLGTAMFKPDATQAALGLGVAAVVGVSVLTGFSSIYIIPLMIFCGLMLMNIFIFPLSFLVDATTPEPLRLFLTSIFGLLELMVFIKFVRGSG